MYMSEAIDITKILKEFEQEISKVQNKEELIEKIKEFLKKKYKKGEDDIKSLIDSIGLKGSPEFFPDLFSRIYQNNDSQIIRGNDDTYYIFELNDNNSLVFRHTKTTTDGKNKTSSSPHVSVLVTKNKISTDKKDVIDFLKNKENFVDFDSNKIGIQIADYCITHSHEIATAIFTLKKLSFATTTKNIEDFKKFLEEAKIKKPSGEETYPPALLYQKLSAILEIYRDITTSGEHNNDALIQQLINNSLEKFRSELEKTSQIVELCYQFVAKKILEDTKDNKSHTKESLQRLIEKIFDKTSDKNIEYEKRLLIELVKILELSDKDLEAFKEILENIPKEKIFLLIEGGEQSPIGLAIQHKETKKLEIMLEKIEDEKHIEQLSQLLEKQKIGDVKDEKTKEIIVLLENKIKKLKENKEEIKTDKTNTGETNTGETNTGETNTGEAKTGEEEKETKIPPEQMATILILKSINPPKEKILDYYKNLKKFAANYSLMAVLSEEDLQTRIKKCFIGKHSEKLKPFILLQEFFLTPEQEREAFIKSLVSVANSVEEIHDIGPILRNFLEILNEAGQNLLTGEQQTLIRRTIQTRNTQTLSALKQANDEALNLGKTNQAQTRTMAS